MLQVGEAAWGYLTATAMLRCTSADRLMNADDARRTKAAAGAAAAGFVLSTVADSLLILFIGIKPPPENLGRDVAPKGWARSGIPDDAP